MRVGERVAGRGSGSEGRTGAEGCEWGSAQGKKPAWGSGRPSCLQSLYNVIGACLLAPAGCRLCNLFPSHQCVPLHSLVLLV